MKKVVLCGSLIFVCLVFFIRIVIWVFSFGGLMVIVRF